MVKRICLFKEIFINFSDNKIIQVLNHITFYIFKAPPEEILIPFLEFYYNLKHWVVVVV